MTTVWYDHTISLRAISRNGIAATEWSLGSGLADIDPGLRSFRLDDQDRLVEIDRAGELAAAVYADPNGGLGPAQFPRTWRSDVRAALNAALGPSAVPVIHAVARARMSVGQARARARSLLTPKGDDPVVIDALVGRDDVVVSMGADWGGGVLDALGRLRAATGCRVVVMVYDLIPLTHTHLAFHKDRDLFERYYRKVIEVADLVTCISAATRDDLLGFAGERGLTVRGVEVLHLGDADADDDVADDAGALHSGRRGSFHLWVGTVERRKNFELIYDAMRIIESEGHAPPTLVVAGQRGWGVNDVLAEIELGTSAASRSIVLLGSVPDRTLAALYSRAASLVFPSFYEGWGLPLREAAVRGCPVAAGDTPASREALHGVDGARFLPTDDPAPWADHLMHPPAPVPPAVRRSWPDAAVDLRGLIDALAGGGA